MVVDSQYRDFLLIVIIVFTVDNSGYIQTAYCSVIDHSAKEFTSIGWGRASVEVPAKRGYSAYRVGSHTLLTGKRVIKGLTDE